MTNFEQFRTKCCEKLAATLTLASTDVFLIKQMILQEGTLFVLICFVLFCFFKNESKFVDFILLLLKINEA